MNESLRCAVVTISDRVSRNERPDLSGQAVGDEVRKLGWAVAEKRLIADDLRGIEELLEELADGEQIDVIFTTGGTGCAPRDVTPEATLAVIERNVPGLAEAMRAASLQSNLHGMLSRAVTGIRRNTLIINLPGSPSGAVENMAVVAPALPHAVALIHASVESEAGHQLIH